MNILENFKLKDEKEDFEAVIKSIDKGVVFKGTNLWVLVFAIFIASLGLNVNSTAVIIGAMLVSPLMGPIVGLGLGMAINDLALLRKAAFNYLFATGVSLLTSTLYFLLSPLNDAHSEILARTAPNIYDVLIAFFGGLAGILATASRHKGNVIPGVAIATALMPPLCTAGYGLATFKFEFFFGALYLYLINSVFIALATLLTTRFLKFPFKHLPQRQDEVKARRIVWGVVTVTLLPSIYLGYNLVQQSKFQKKAERFIESEANFPNNYLLKKLINFEDRTIKLTYGGQYIEKEQIAALKARLAFYSLEATNLDIMQGFAYLQERKENHEDDRLTLILNEKEAQLQVFRHKEDSLEAQKQLSRQVFNELKAQYPALQALVVQPAIFTSNESQGTAWISLIKMQGRFEKNEQRKVERWLKTRLNTNNITLNFEE